MEKVTDLTARLAAPIVEEQGCSLWDVEYVKEAGTWYLRVLIDKEGGVDILDCENISRALSDLLDEADPIEGSYTLEVGSAVSSQNGLDALAGALSLLLDGGADDLTGTGHQGDLAGSKQEAVGGDSLRIGADCGGGIGSVGVIHNDVLPFQIVSC